MILSGRMRKKYPFDVKSNVLSLMAHFPCKSLLDSVGRSEGEEYFTVVFDDCDCVCG